MSNTQMEFGAFAGLAAAYPERRDALAMVNAAVSGATIERWVDPANPQYGSTWDTFIGLITRGGLTPAQVQVVWAKHTDRGRQGALANRTDALGQQLGMLARELKIRLPNLRIIYFSSRTRAFAYLGNNFMEPAAFETGLAVRHVIEAQMNGDPSLNFDPDRGPVAAPFLSWGPHSGSMARRPAPTDEPGRSTTPPTTARTRQPREARWPPR